MYSKEDSDSFLDIEFPSSRVDELLIREAPTPRHFWPRPSAVRFSLLHIFLYILLYYI